MTFGERLRALRDHHHQSQSELAEFIGVSKGAVSQWELDDVRPTWENLMHLAEHFNVTLDWLVAGKRPPRAPYRIDATGLTEYHFPNKKPGSPPLT